LDDAIILTELLFRQSRGYQLFHITQQTPKVKSKAARLFLWSLAVLSLVTDFLNTGI